MKCPMWEQHSDKRSLCKAEACEKECELWRRDYVLKHTCEMRLAKSREENAVSGVGWSNCINFRAQGIKYGVWHEEGGNGRENIMGGL